MTRSKERRMSPKPPAEASDPVVAAGSKEPPSPTGSSKSSDSEGKPVRDKLKDTRIDAQTSSDPARASDHTMKDAPNGTDEAAQGDGNTSGSDSGRGRIRRKRSREDFEDDEKLIEKKKIERHVRKKSRDITSPHPAEAELSGRSMKSSVTRIDENDGDEHMSTAGEKTNGRATPEATLPNKRTHDQAKGDEGAVVKDSDAAVKAEEEREAKRQREKASQPTEGAEESKTKIPPTSGFANASASSPFASLGSKSQPAATKEKPTEDLPQTSDDKFKKSGFGSFASSSASPFGGLGGSGSKSPSPFAAATGAKKVSTFASSTSASTTAPSGFGAVGGASKSVFGGGSTPATGGSVFGGSLGSSAFGGLGGAKSSLSSFATPGASTIKGLSKTERAFGAAGNHESEEEDDGSDDNDDTQENDGSEKTKPTETTKRVNLTPLESIETGEEGEDVIWSGRAKLYKMDGEDGKKAWKEAGTGPFKFNITKDAPKKARFILRADGTHRLLLNAAITKTLTIGGDLEGNKPTDGRLLFLAPAADGTLEKLLLRMKAERAVDLYDTVKDVQDQL